MNQLFKDSPFALTASIANAACWSGRKDVHKRLERLCRSFVGRPDSSFDMVWANFGSGKSHALFRLAYLLQEMPEAHGKVISVFVEMPEQMRHFVDLYRRVMLALPLREMARMITDTGVVSNANLRRAASALLHGGPSEQSLAEQWLHADRPNLRDLKKSTGIDARIESDAIACDTLCDLISATANVGCRLLLLFDEFQRVGVVAKARASVLSNVRSMFSRNPTGLSVVIAVASRMERTATELLPAELRTLMGMRPAVSLPEMNEEEAKDFILGRLEFFRPVGYAGSPEAPFSEEVIREVLSYISAKDSARLIPRTILQAFAYVFDEIEPNNSLTEMEPSNARQMLDELQWEA